MPSIQARITKYLLSWTEQNTFRTPENLHKRLKEAREKGDHRPPADVKAKVNIEERESKGFPVYDVTPKSLAEQTPSATIMYLHGGAFIFDITEHHWRFLTELAEQLGASVTVPIYPLGPEHQLPAMYEMLQPVYDELAAAQTEAMPFWVMGDSAGATFTLTLTQAALEAGNPVAARMVPISPAVDVTMKNPQLHLVAATRDPWLAMPGVAESLNLFLQGVPREDPRINAINGRIEGLPSMLLFLATDDLLFPDSQLFAEKAKSKGVDVTVVIGEGLMHVWPVLTLPESMTARKQIVEYLKKSKTN